MDIEYPVLCPLMDLKRIDAVICFDIHLVVDAGAPEYTAPKEATSKENYKRICLSCPYHRDD